MVTVAESVQVFVAKPRAVLLTAVTEPLVEADSVIAGAVTLPDTVTAAELVPLEVASRPVALTIPVDDVASDSLRWLRQFASRG